MRLQSLRRWPAAALALLLAGCAGLSADGGMDGVSALTRARIGQPVGLLRTEADHEAVARRVAELLGTPLSADAAVELALLNNRGLQASFGQLGIADADRVRAGRLRNPVFGFGRLSAGGLVEIERGLVFDLLGLLTMPAARAIQEERFQSARLQAASAAIGIAADTRRAWIAAVADAERAGHAEQVREAADAADALARRMATAGNVNALAQLREQAFLADATAGLARARQQAVASRERLVRLLGLSGEAAGLRLPDRLPALPAAPVAAGDLERTALEQRLDVLIARREVDATARSLGLSKVTRYADAAEVGYRNRSETGSARANGYELGLPVPLFDFGSAEQARAEAVYRQAVHRAADAAIRARSEVREAEAAYRSAWTLARHYRDEVLPLRRRISEENLLRYNGMLIGVFELLADAREQIQAVADAVAALRDFWIAETDLKTALNGRSPNPQETTPQPQAQP